MKVVILFSVINGFFGTNIKEFLRFDTIEACELARVQIEQVRKGTMVCVSHIITN